MTNINHEGHISLRYQIGNSAQCHIFSFALTLPLKAKPAYQFVNQYSFALNTSYNFMLKNLFSNYTF